MRQTHILQNFRGRIANYPAVVHNTIPSRGRILFRLNERHKSGLGKDMIITDTIP
jgi:hypothetical protein